MYDTRVSWWYGDTSWQERRDWLVFVWGVGRSGATGLYLGGQFNSWQERSVSLFSRKRGLGCEVVDARVMRSIDAPLHGRELFGLHVYNSCGHVGSINASGHEVDKLVWRCIRVQPFLLIEQPYGWQLMFILGNK